MRRMWLKDRMKIAKCYLIHTAAFNLGLDNDAQPDGLGHATGLGGRHAGGCLARGAGFRAVSPLFGLHRARAA